MEKQTITLRGREYELPLDLDHPDFNGEVPWYNPDYYPDPTSGHAPHLSVYLSESNLFGHNIGGPKYFIKKAFGVDTVWKRTSLDANDSTVFTEFSIDGSDYQIWMMDHAYHLEPYDDFPGYPPYPGEIGRWGLIVEKDGERLFAQRSRWVMFHMRPSSPESFDKALEELLERYKEWKK